MLDHDRDEGETSHPPPPPHPIDPVSAPLDARTAPLNISLKLERSILIDLFACRCMESNVVVDGVLRWMLLLTEVSGATDKR
jgi:hypothetical protein